MTGQARVKNRQLLSCGQATKGLRRIPRHIEAMKDVVTDETLRGAGNKR